MTANRHQDPEHDAMIARLRDLPGFKAMREDIAYEENRRAGMAYDTQAPQDQGTPALRPGFVWVEVGIVASTPEEKLNEADQGGDYDVTDPETARTAARELLGSERQVQRTDDLGWLVEFTEEEWHELESQGWFGRENDLYSLEAEMS